MVARLAMVGFLVLGSLPSRPAEITNAASLIAAMQVRYAGTWYKTSTFVQKTTTFNADGTKKIETWYEAMSLPGFLRIDFTPVKNGNGILFANGQMYTFKDGKLDNSRAFIHPLLLLGFDIYKLPEATVIEQLAGLKFDLASFHEDTWLERPAYVVGAPKGDLHSAQFWIDRERLVFVRMIRPAGPNGSRTQETQFNNYKKLGGGWMSPEVIFKTDGVTMTTEEYSQLRADVPLDAKVFDPKFWVTAHWKSDTR